MSLAMKSSPGLHALSIIVVALLAPGALSGPALGAGANLLLEKSNGQPAAPEPEAAANGAVTYLELGPLLGHISSSNALVWVKASGAARLSVRVGQKMDLSDGAEIKGPRLAADTDFMGQVLLPKLNASRGYHYCVLLDGKPAMLPPYPSFATAPPDLQRQSMARGKYLNGRA